ncbi:hypothetical protein GIB67_037115 [Kingdonia uniflora]|uniref:Uncharacterized protein n=1 Tax=Kingdonia uniflora TaxID=39325 RepID=A0A7J7LHT6_9MAGN|nr:hypothetical protein GIB67_037115 [Kingdonia uniflora]
MAGIVAGNCYSSTSPMVHTSHLHFAQKLPIPSQFVKKGRFYQYKISAIFWGPKKTAHFLGEFDLEGGSADEVNPRRVTLSVISSIFEVSPSEWDACAVDATGYEKRNPFLMHGFLSSLEESGSAVKETGWLAQHIIARDEFQNILGVVPLYLKRFSIFNIVSNVLYLNSDCSHSYGEFVFDHSWADAYYNYGSRYYPKLQCCVPFTPVTGQRILIRNFWYKNQVFDKLVSALKDLAVKFQVSSLHVTFPSENEWRRMKEHSFLQRIGMQYHWTNRNYKNFDEFLMDMKQSKRKNIRQERKKVSTQSLNMKRLRGDEVKARHWDSFYKFYESTTDNKLVPSR